MGSSKREASSIFDSKAPGGPSAVSYPRLLIMSIARLVGPRLAGRIEPSSILARLLRPVANRALRGAEVLVPVASGPAKGLRLFIDSRGEKFYWSGNHEQHVMAALSRMLQPGDCFWDVGAHIGYVSCFAAKQVNTAGEVVAFEPLGPTRERLRKNAEINGLGNIVIAPYALAHTSGKGQLFDGGTSLTWSLDESSSREGSSRDSIIIDRITLDAALELYSPPTVIKIDAEGAELEVIRGGQSLLTQHRPMLLVEFTTGGLVDSARRELPGYSFELLAANHWLLCPLRTP